MVDVSVVICTRNRAQMLHASLESVAVATRACGAEAELVIVDNASSDGTEAVVRAWAASAGLRVTLMRELKPGLAAARNAGVRAAHGAVLAFTDDDCRLAPDYLRVLLDLFARDRGGMVVRGGRVDLGDPADLPFTVKTDPAPAAYDGGRHPGGFIHGCNMAMTRATFDRIGAFDERFGAGAPLEAGEDTDYLYRAFLAGIPVEYAPSLAVAHHHGRRSRTEIANLNSVYARGNGALYLKHARHWNLFRNFVWDLKGSVRELFGGAPIDPAFGFTYRANVLGCLHGMGRFAALALRDALRRRRRQRP